VTRSYWIKYFLPGILLIGLAFFAGAQKNFFLGLVGFVSFFCGGDHPYHQRVPKR